MSLFPLDEETKRRLALTPGFNPELPEITLPTRRPTLTPPTLPEAPTRMPGAPSSSPFPETAMPKLSLPAAGGGVPGGMPMPAPRPQGRGEQLSEARDVYLQGTPGRGKSTGLGILRGVAQGLAGGGGLGGALGGAVAGGLFGGISPKGLREVEFNERVKPKIYERFALEDADRNAQIALAKAGADQAMNRMQLENLGSQIQSRAEADKLAKDKEEREKGKPLIVGRSAIDPKTHQPVFTDFDPRLGSMTDDQAAATLTGREGTVEEVSQGSLRGRTESLKKHLTPEENRMVFGQTTSKDDPRAIAAAKQKWEKIQRDELDSIRRDTGERRKANISRLRFGRKGQPNRRAISVQEADDLLR